MSRITLTAASRVGCIRSNNEDMVLAYDKLVRSDAYQTEFMTENTDRFVISVADGMGGHQAGEVASELTLKNLKFYVNDLPKTLSPSDFSQAMTEWVQSISTTVNNYGRQDDAKRGMGTTLVGIIYYIDRYYWMNCGDSRVYRLRDGELHQLSVDHSLNNMMGEARHSNVITNCIGGGAKQSYLDLVEMTDDFLPGDVYLLCSDGLNDLVPNENICKMLVEGASANTLCEAAIEAGGFDNVSAVVINVLP